MNEVFFLLGSNLGDRLDYLSKASDFIEQKIGKIFRKSSIYETAAYGNTDQPSYLNLIISVLTDKNPNDLLEITMNIEKSMGRIRKEKWEAREIDVDILFYGDQIIDTPNLKIPHPGIELRQFTLIPLNEIIPFFSHPNLKKQLSEVIKENKDTLEVKLFNATIHNKIQ